MANLKNKVVLITGGTGFLGKALVNEFLKQKLKKLIIFQEMNKNNFILLKNLIKSNMKF